MKCLANILSMVKSSKRMDKGLAIKKVVETLHMKMEDTIAFGDSMNDYEMLQVCNYGVAMKNACQELKASADNICESVENDGVYYEMERLGLFECLDYEQLLIP